MLNYLRNLSNPRLVLWCYFAWYLVVLGHHFDATPAIWLSSLGISLFVGFALYLNTISGKDGMARADLWQTARCFLTPFCVSSFAALVKGKGFFLIFSPRLNENFEGLVICLAMVTLTILPRRNKPTYPAEERS